MYMHTYIHAYNVYIRIFIHKHSSHPSKSNIRLVASTIVVSVVVSIHSEHALVHKLTLVSIICMQTCYIVIQSRHDTMDRQQQIRLNWLEAQEILVCFKVVCKGTNVINIGLYFDIIRNRIPKSISHEGALTQQLCRILSIRFKLFHLLLRSWSVNL